MFVEPMIDMVLDTIEDIKDMVKDTIRTKGLKGLCKDFLKVTTAAVVVWGMVAAMLLLA